MTKSFTEFYHEIYLPKTPQDKKMMDGHKDVKVTPDANGNGDDVFKGTNVKVIDRSKDRHGNPPNPNESLEEQPLQELSKKTLKSYINKADKAGDKAWDKASAEEDKAMATDGEKYPEKQKRHNDNANKHIATWRKRESGRILARTKLGNLPK